MGERGRGALLYALATALLVAGAGWFVRAAPATGDDRRVPGWQRDAARLLPDRPDQVKAETVVVGAGATTERSADVTGGSYQLSMICVGDGGHVRVRLSASADADSGRAVPCAARPSAVTLTVAVASQLFMLVSGEAQAGTAVFRWRLDRTRPF